ncbi:putative bifunctional diguanylate cyclase/phosphodiesterase [Pseudaquabacterium rugosum]|uniref:EAL domain-containing protein n=1 Tax=Pseudaquabacterium rugosum TaxID=2984194 RepID=A0ABU9BC37_9BURK
MPPDPTAAAPRRVRPAYGHVLRLCWTLPEATPDERRRLLNLQAASVAVTGWLGDVVLLVVAAAVLAADPAPPAWAPLWLLAMLGCDLLGRGIGQRAESSSETRGGGPRDFRLAPLCLWLVLKAAVFGSGLAWLYLHRDDTLRVMIAGVSVGAMCGGALRRARLPQAAAVWILVHGVIGVITLALMPRRMETAVFIALLLWVLLLLVTILNISRQFVQACRREFDAERQAHVLQLLLDDVEGASRDWFWDCDDEGRLTHASPRLADWLGCPPAELPGRRLSDTLAGAGVDFSALRQLDARLAAGKPFRELLLPVRRDEHVQRWWSLSAKPLRAADGAAAGWRGVGIDVTESHQHQLALGRLARTDVLTGLSSRLGFNERLRQLRREDGSLQPAALIMLDLDRFKAINDGHGHAVGDQLLQAVARRLATCSGGPDCLARLGGDEFALLLPGEWRDEALARRAEAVLTALRAPLRLGGLQLNVRASLGIAAAPRHATDADALQRAADIALYAAKHRGRDAWALYTPVLGERARQRALLLQDLGHALRDGQLMLDYQLIVDGPAGRPLAAEALLRWRHPHHGAVEPAIFVTLAEEGGQILDIGRWVLRQACRDAAGWSRPLTVAVNLSPVQLRCPGLVDDVAAALHDSGLPPQRLELELTESAVAGDEVADVLRALRALGVRLALDDFGTGHSSLAQLQRHGFDRLKIDRAFVAPLAAADAGQALALVGAIVTLARALGLACTAEGVEQATQEAHLQALGCEAMQGFRYHRPCAAAHLPQSIDTALARAA